MAKAGKSKRATAIPTPGPWKFTNAVKASNFGGTAARVTAMIPDPAKPGEMTSVTIAKVFGGSQEDRALAESNARLIAAVPDLVKALQRAERLINEALPKFDWGKPALDANAITLLNEVPIDIRKALALASPPDTAVSP